MSADDTSDFLSPPVVKAARALLAWSQKELAEQANVATSTIADFERGQRTPVANTASAIKSALEAAGITFLPNGAVHGPTTVSSVKVRPAGVPARLITEEDLLQWGNSLDATAHFPTLIAHLVRATTPGVRVRFPSEEGVRHPGFDGWSVTSEASTYVPGGQVAWELTVQRSNTATKASTDIAKRAEQHGFSSADPDAFVFVTLRRWPDKDRWAAAQQAARSFKAVLAYDVTDLVHWTEAAPDVGLWLAKRLNKLPPEGLQLASEVWFEWSLATVPSFPAALALADRDEDAAALLKWLRELPSVLSIQATTTGEGVAFARAAIYELPEEIAAPYDARLLVVNTETAARALLASSSPLVVLLVHPDVGLAQRLARHGHHVLQIYDDQTRHIGSVRTLARPSKQAIELALVDAGLSDATAHSLARQSGRNLSILRRLMPFAQERGPGWALQKPSRALIAALLVGGWDEDEPADVEIVEKLAGADYDSVVRELTALVGNLDQPLRKVGPTWRVASPKDAWLLLAPHVTQGDIDGFQEAAVAVLGSTDPTYQLPPEERWRAALTGIRPKFSSHLRHGMSEVLIILGVWGEHLHMPNRVAEVAPTTVARLLSHADAQRWWSMSRDLALLAEAAPEAFLDAVEQSLGSTQLPITGLLQSDGSWLTEGDKLYGLLSALETLAWAPGHLARVTFALARLSDLDAATAKGRNRPASSLREIYLFWLPQTYAPLTQRLELIDALRNRHADAAWQLMLGLLPQGHDSSSMSSQPQWRDFSGEEQEEPTWRIIQRGAQAISTWLVEDVGTAPSRWEALLQRLKDLAPSDSDRAIDKFQALALELSDQGARRRLQDALRTLLHHHRQFPTADWVLDGTDLDRLDRVYQSLAPSDPVERIAWLFADGARSPSPTSDNWDTDAKALDLLRQKEVLAMWNRDGLTGLIALAAVVQRPDLVGRALAHAEVEANEIDELLALTLRSDVKRVEHLGGGYISEMSYRLQEPWLRDLLARHGDATDPMVRARILLAAPPRRWVWDLVAEHGREVADCYWQAAHVHRSDTREDDEYASRQLISAGRPIHALPIAARDKGAGLPTVLLIELLQLSTEVEDKGVDQIPGGGTMYSHYISELFLGLDQREDVSPQTIARLEWIYLRVLDFAPRKPTAIYRELARSPEFFVDLVKTIFKPDPESTIEDTAPEDSDVAAKMAQQGYHLLEHWHHLPGTQADGTVDGSKLQDWVSQARRLAQQAGRGEIADFRIGTMLAGSNLRGDDSHWPLPAVRRALDHFDSERMIDGFVNGKQNRRGATSRALREGGGQERALADAYRASQRALVSRFPVTARALARLAQAYEEQSRWHDERAERLDL